MRIVDRKAFLAMPAGTVYVQYVHQWVCDDIRVKGETWTDDWQELILTDIDTTAPHHEVLDIMLATGQSEALDLDAWGRDGMFEPNAVFLVYEKPDLIKLRDLFTRLVEQTE